MKISSYCTPSELRTQMEKDGITGAASDAALGIIIRAVSVAIDGFYKRPDGFIADSVASARIYPGSGKPVQRIDDCVEITLVAVKGSPTDTAYTNWASTDWIAFTGAAMHPDFNSLPYTHIMIDLANGSYSYFTSGMVSGRRGFSRTEAPGYALPTVQVTARWGYSDMIPPILNEATIALATRWMKQGQSAWTDTLASTEFGGLIYKAQNADIRFMLENAPFRRAVIGLA